MLVYLVNVELAADLEGVTAEYAGECIAQIVSVVDLRFIRDWNAHHECRKGDILHSFKLWRLHKDAGSSRTRREPLRSQADA